jgi:hypothetical protein
MDDFKEQESALGFASNVRNEGPETYGVLETAFGYDSAGRVQTSR